MTDNNYEFTNGLRNIDDASFVREKIIPLAIENRKWNLVISESHRAVELLLDGLIYLIGGDPLQNKHNLEGLVQKFEQYLMGSKENVPFGVGYYSDNGDCYGLEIKNNSIQVLQKVKNIYVAILYVTCMPEELEENSKIKLEIDGSGTVTLMINDRVRATHPGSTLRNSPLTPIYRQFNIKPRSKRFVEMKKLGQSFTHGLLLDARYSKREFTEVEALEIKGNMDRIFEVSKNMISVGK